MTLTPTLAAAIGGVIEIVFAAYVFSKASANTAAP
jgi:hypothetical protein